MERARRELVFATHLAPNIRPAVAELPAMTARGVIRLVSGSANARLQLVPREAALYAPIALYPDLCNRRTFDGWWNTGSVPRDGDFRARYAWIVLWPASDPPGDPREGALVDSLANDPGFAERSGYEPLRVFERR